MYGYSGATAIHLSSRSKLSKHACVNSGMIQQVICSNKNICRSFVVWRT